jgi:hypothetical protein
MLLCQFVRCSGAKWPLDAIMSIYWVKGVRKLPNCHYGDFSSITMSGGRITPMKLFYGCKVLNGQSIKNQWFLVWRALGDHPILMGLLFIKHLFASMCRTFFSQMKYKRM